MFRPHKNKNNFWIKILRIIAAKIIIFFERPLTKYLALVVFVSAIAANYAYPISIEAYRNAIIFIFICGLFFKLRDDRFQTTKDEEDYKNYLKILEILCYVVAVVAAVVYIMSYW